MTDGDPRPDWSAAERRERGAWTTLLYRERRIFTLVMLMVAALGALASTTIGRQEDPTITNLFASVITPFPGADPERVEALITDPIEAELRKIPEVKRLRSSSRTGLSLVEIELTEFIAKDRIEQVWSETRDALSDAATFFPEGAADPEFDNDRVGAFTAIFTLTAQGAASAPPIAIMTRYAERIEDRLRAVSGTELVSLYGAASEEVLVRIDPLKLSSAGLTPGAVATAIAEADAKTPAGRVRGPGSDYLLEVSGEIQDLDRIRSIPLTSGGAFDGPLLRVGDVAEVSRGVRTPPSTVALADGARTILIAARMTPDLQVDAWMARVARAVEASRAELPGRLTLTQTFDQSAYTTDRLAELGANLGLGVLLVVLVLLATLGWRAAMVVAVILPLTSLLSLFILQKIGVVIHQMSVTGLIVALGLMVDGAIVMTDEIRKRLAAGAPRLAAVGASVRRLSIPLLSSTATTVLAFLPMALLPGPAGDFVGSIALSVIVMLSSSLLLALTVTPALAGFLLPTPSARGAAAKPNLMVRAYLGLLALTLRWRGPAALIAATPALVGFLAFPTLTAQFFPGVERDQFYVQVTLPLGASLSETRRVAAEADAALRADQDVTAVQWVIGESAPAFYYNMLPGRDGVAEFAEALVTTSSPEATRRLLRDMQLALDQKTPEARFLVRGLVQGPPVRAPIEMRILGPDLDTLTRLGADARAMLANMPSVTHARAGLSGGAPKLVLDLDEDKARLAGLSLSDVARQYESLIEGAVGGSLIEGPEQLPVRIRVGADDRSAADRIADLRVLPPDATARAARGEDPGVPLAALGALSLQPAQADIDRFNGERVNTVEAFLQPGVLPEEALQAFQNQLAATPLDLPQGYRIDWGGDSDARAETVTNLLSSVGLVVSLTVATILLTFNSWRLSAVAGVVVILSTGLSLLALAVFQYPFGINALIGVIGSIGVSINAAIIIMTALQEDPKARRGDPEAIVAVVSGSTRHIVSTTVTTFGGFLPLILGGGGFWPPFAMAVAGGVLLSTIVSLFFTPPVYSLVVGRSKAGAPALASAAAGAPA